MIQLRASITVVVNNIPNMTRYVLMVLESNQTSLVKKHIYINLMLPATTPIDGPSSEGIFPSVLHVPERHSEEVLVRVFKVLSSESLFSVVLLSLYLDKVSGNFIVVEIGLLVGWNVGLLERTSTTGGYWKSTSSNTSMIDVSLF